MDIYSCGRFCCKWSEYQKSPGISPQTTCLHMLTQGTSRPSIIDIKSSPRYHQSQTISSNGPTIHLLCFQLIITMNIKDVHHITITDLQQSFRKKLKPPQKEILGIHKFHGYHPWLIIFFFAVIRAMKGASHLRTISGVERTTNVKGLSVWSMKGHTFGMVKWLRCWWCWRWWWWWWLIEYTLLEWSIRWI